VSEDLKITHSAFDQDQQVALLLGPVSYGAKAEGRDRSAIDRKPVANSRDSRNFSALLTCYPEPNGGFGQEQMVMVGLRKLMAERAAGTWP
jgi:hypothetical protein